MTTLTPDLKFMVCVIQTVMILHDSKYAQNTTPEGIVETLENLYLFQYPDRDEFLGLLKTLIAEK